MKMTRVELKDITVIQYSMISELSLKEQYEKIRKVLLASVYGQVFIVNAQNELLGSLSVNGEWITSLREVPCIYEDNIHGRLRDQILKVLADNPFVGLLPIVDEKNKLVAGVTCTDNMWYNDKIQDLAYLNYLYEKNVDIGYYFREKGYHRIAFWGIDKLSLTFANILRNCMGVTVLGIYDNQKLKGTTKENYINYEVDINFVTSIEEIFKINDIDLVIITDWTMRNIGKVAECKNVTFIYSNQLLKSLEFQRDMNTVTFLRWKKNLEKKGIECLSVRIPTEFDLGIDTPKGKRMTEKEKIAWIARENGWNIDSDEVMEFTKSRWAFQKNIIKSDGKVYFADYRSKYINYINKSRITLNNPSEYDNTIYLIGPCIVTSVFSQDNATLGFFLQDYLNKNCMKYKVVALGQSNDADRYFYFNALKDEELKPGDKVFWIDQTKLSSNWDLDTKRIFEILYSEYGEEFYYDAVIHCGREGMKRVAGFLFEYIKEHNKVPVREFLCTEEETESKNAKVSKSFEGNPKLEEYKKYIKKEMIHKKLVIGSIVMNCNPFTLGHQYLIEYASSQVDFLYIFVVEEDRSFFKFDDRIRLVKEGTAHINNVKVLPSGEFIISANTFSEYFDKANLKGTVVDTSLDVETFATQIAPCLDISIRFVGEEPLDPITNQYNQSMKRILPRYGIELREIPRKEFGERVISASRVRECLKNNQWEEISRLVPKTTYDYLQTTFGGS